MSTPFRFPASVSRALALALCVGAVSSASGCIIIADGSGEYWQEDTVKETRVLHADHVTGKPIKVASFNGSITIRKGGTDKVDITANIRARDKARLEKVEVRVTRGADGALDIEPWFPDNKHKSGEGCSFEITVPDATNVSVETSNGAVDVQGLAGKAVLNSSNGAITLASHAGDAKIETSNGRIKVRSTSGDIHAESSNGAIDIADAAGKVHAETSNGSIECAMADTAPGPVSLASTNGAVELRVGAGFGGELVADTSNASVKLVNVSTENTKVEKSHASLKFKNAGGKSTLDTSNGSITIRGGA